MARTAKDIVSAILEHATDIEALRHLVSPTCTYTSLCYSNPALKKLMPYAGVHKSEGPEAIRYTFATVGTIWQKEDFQILSFFSDEGSSDQEGDLANVAVFGKFTYRSSVLGKKYTSPFNVWCVVDINLGDGDVRGQVVEMQFMEDTFGTAATFEKEGKKVYEVVKGKDVVIGLTGDDVADGDRI